MDRAFLLPSSVAPDTEVVVASTSLSASASFVAEESLSDSDLVSDSLGPAP